MAENNIVLPCAARPLDVGNGQTVEVTYSQVVDREACLFEASEDAQYRRAWRVRQIQPGQVGMAWCSDCGDWRPLSYFGDDARRVSGKRVYCRECERKRDHARYERRRASGSCK